MKYMIMVIIFSAFCFLGVKAEETSQRKEISLGNGVTLVWNEENKSVYLQSDAPLDEPFSQKVRAELTHVAKSLMTYNSEIKIDGGPKIQMGHESRPKDWSYHLELSRTKTIVTLYLGQYININ
jgi:hypothetical protein